MSSSKSCIVCGIKTNLKSCSRCFEVYYCCPDHQQIDWKSHRINCKQFIDSLIIESNNCLKSEPQLDIQINNSFDNKSDLKPIVSEKEVSEESVIESQMESLRFQESVNYNHNKQLSSGTNSQIFVNNIPSNSRQNSLTSLVFNGFNNNNNRNNDNLIAIRELLISRQEKIKIKLNSYCPTVLRDLNEFGVCVIDNFLDNGSEILTEVQSLYALGLFRAGQVVNNRASNTHLIRGDHIVWVDGTEQVCPNIGFLIRTLDSIVKKCNSIKSEGQFAKYRINRRTKAMIACYPGNNAKYVRHIDNPNNDGRCITSIYYLNKDYDRQVFILTFILTLILILLLILLLILILILSLLSIYKLFILINHS